MTLIGLDSRSEEFDNLTLTVGMGTKLTLQDVRITGDKTLLSLAGGNTLTLLGENRLIGCADASGNACLTVISGGDLTICGSGSLKLQALVNNAAFMGAETSKISIETCLISVFKSDKLGFDCGAFCANGADLTMTNATFFGRTDSDNVAVLSADTIAMTGCTLRVEAEKSVHALLGSVSIADCSLYASGHSGNSAKTVSQTAGLDAFETVSQQSGVTLCRCQDRSCLPAGCFVLHGRRTDDRNWESGVLSGQAHDPRHARHRSLAHGRKSCRAGKWRLYRPESRLVPAGRRLGRAERHCCRNRRGHVLPGYSCHKGAGCRTAGSIRPDAWHFHPG